MSQNTKQYATIEQALEMVGEYMKGKGLEEFGGFDGENEWTAWGDEFVEYFLIEEDFFVILSCKSIELLHEQIWYIPLSESKEDFITLMKILDV